MSASPHMLQPHDAPPRQLYVASYAAVVQGTDLHQPRLAAGDQQLPVGAVAPRVRAVLEPRQLPLAPRLSAAVAQQHLRTRPKTVIRSSDAGERTSSH